MAFSVSPSRWTARSATARLPASATSVCMASTGSSPSGWVSSTEVEAWKGAGFSTLNAAPSSRPIRAAVIHSRARRRSAALR